MRSRALKRGWPLAPGSILPGSQDPPVPPPVPTYDPDAQALFARFATDPGPTRKQLISDRFVAGKALSFWTKLDALWVHAAHGPEAGRLNWLGDIYNCVPINNPAFTIDRGYMGDGSTSYLDTGFNPVTAVNPKYQRLSGCLGIRSNTNNRSGGSLAGFFDGNQGTTINPADTSGNAFARLNQGGGSPGVTSPNSIGMFVTNRVSNTDMTFFKDGALLVRTASNPAASVMANGAMRLGSITNGSLRACQFAMGFVGAGLTDQEALELFNWFEPYRTAVGVT